MKKKKFIKEINEDINKNIKVQGELEERIKNIKLKLNRKDIDEEFMLKTDGLNKMQEEVKISNCKNIYLIIIR